MKSNRPPNVPKKLTSGVFVADRDTLTVVPLEDTNVVMLDMHMVGWTRHNNNH